jgi:hypothetical protein
MESIFFIDNVKWKIILVRFEVLMVLKISSVVLLGCDAMWTWWRCR